MTAAAVVGATDERRYGLGLAVALLALLALRLFANAVSHTNLVFDEAQYWTWSKDLAFGYFSKPPMIAWAIRAATTVCGDGEACVRSMSPIMYTLATGFVFLTARQLYDARTGFWAGLIFATLPGISFSSTLASTDVPLLLFWSVALFAYVRLIETKSLGWAFTLGCAIGLGMLSKYAMAYFVPCALLHAYLSPRAREALSGYRGLLALGIGILLLIPNLLWNLDNHFITFRHTAQNARWFGPPIHPVHMLQFLGGQFGVVGPIVFAMLLWIGWRAIRDRSNDDEQRLLLSFSLPILTVITIEAFISRAHANWAAVAYPSAAILVAAVLLKERWRRLFRITIWLHAVVAVAIAFTPFLLPRYVKWAAADLYGRLLGWPELVGGIEQERERQGAKMILTDDRMVSAELLYYMRANPTPVHHWNDTVIPLDHYQLKTPFVGTEPGPWLYVTQWPNMDRVTSRFTEVEKLPFVTSAPDGDKSRTLYMYRLGGFTSYPNE